MLMNESALMIETVLMSETTWTFKRPLVNVDTIRLLQVKFHYYSGVSDRIWLNYDVY